jgi:signal peptidase I
LIEFAPPRQLNHWPAIELAVKLQVAIPIIASSLALSCCLFNRGSVVFEGTSMLPTIQNGQRLKTIRLDSQSRTKLARGDIVAFWFPKDTSKSYMKRIVALPGETVEIQKAEVWVNGTKLSEPYVAPKFNVSLRPYTRVTVPLHSYYVLGDNRDNSSDSRLWGFVPEDLIYAEVVGL